MIELIAPLALLTVLMVAFFVLTANSDDDNNGGGLPEPAFIPIPIKR